MAVNPMKAATRLFPTLVVGLSGCSCGGKTTLTKLFKSYFPWASVLHQDAYFHPNEAKYHVYLEDIDHFNWELKTALDLKSMELDLHELIQSNPRKRQKGRIHPDKRDAIFFENNEYIRSHYPEDDRIRTLGNRLSAINLIFVEGHIIFNHEPFYKECNLKYFIMLDREECRQRRMFRNFNPPNPPGFFEKYVWPAYVTRLAQVQRLPNITYFDGTTVPLLHIFNSMFTNVVDALEKMRHNYEIGVQQTPQHLKVKK